MAVTGLKKIIDQIIQTVTISGTITDGGSGKTLKNIVLSLSQGSDQEVIAEVNGKVLKVYGYSLQSRADDITVQFTDGASTDSFTMGEELTARWALNTREGIIKQGINPPNFFFKTTQDTGLFVTIGGTGTVDIDIQYWDDDES